MDGLHRFARVAVTTAVLVGASLTGSAFAGGPYNPPPAVSGRSGGGGAAAGQKTLAASEAWVKLPAAGDTSATVFVLIDNPTMYDVYLVSAASDVAGGAQFREKAVTAGRAQPVAEMTAPAYGKLQLTPDGAHIVLLNLTRALEEGETVTLTLTTDAGVALQVPALVRQR